LIHLLYRKAGLEKWCLWMEDFAGQDRSMVFAELFEMVSVGEKNLDR